MALLGRRLVRHGHRPSLFGYSVRRSPLERIAARFAQHVDHGLTEASEAERAGYAVVGHSLGNVITRLAADALPPGFQRFVMLAPPNSPPALARMLRDHPLYRALTHDAGQRLADPAFFSALSKPEVPTLVLAGSSAPRWLPHRGRPSDGVVAIAETKLDGAEHEVLPASHTFIMNDPRVARRVVEFLGAAQPVPRSGSGLR